MRILKSMIECRAKLDAIERSQAVAVFDTDGVITQANPNYLAIMGYSQEELLGRHHSILVDKGHRDSADYRAFWDALRRGDFRSGTFKRVAKDGRTVWSNASYDPLIGRSGRPFGILELAEDITDAIVRSFDNEGQIQAIHKSQAVIEFLPNGTILTANDNFLRTMDYTLAEIEGRHHSIFVEPALRESAEYREFWETLRRGQYQSGEYRRIGRGGRSVWIHGSYNPVHDADGVLQKVVKFAADVTSQAADRIRRAEVQAVIDVDLGAISAAVAMTSSRVAQAASASTLTSNKMMAVASGSKELASSVDEIGRRVADALIISQRAVIQANETNVIISGLANAAQKIGDIVELINTVAGRTNLLALNATIEAARAGEAGRGFAVVASEVKNLATQTAKATAEISDQIDKVQSTAITAASVIEGMAQTITRINDISVAIATAVDQQSAVTRSISENMMVAAQNVGEIDETMSAIAAAAQSVDNATEKVKKASRTLA